MSQLSHTRLTVASIDDSRLMINRGRRRAIMMTAAYLRENLLELLMYSEKKTSSYVSERPFKQIERHI